MFYSKRKLSVAIASAAVVTLAGCGGGGSSSDAGAGGGGAESFSVTAIDGYLTNAEIYIDANSNAVLDNAELTAGAIGSTDAQGKINVDNQYVDSDLLVRAVAGQTRDLDSGIVDTTYVMGADAGSTVITPFTHLAKKSGTSLADLAATLGVDESIVSGDYIALKNDAQSKQAAEVIHALARFVVTELKQENVEESTIESSLGDAKTAIENAISSGEDPDLVEVELDDSGSGAVVEAPSTALAFTEDFLRSEESWTAYRFDDAGDNEQFYFRFGNANDANAFCLESEVMSFLNDATVQPPNEACVQDSTFSVNESGQLELAFSEADTFEMLYRFSEERLTPEGGPFSYKMFLMIKSNGELLWVDNNPFIKDAGDYRGGPNNVVYTFADDDTARGVIEPLVYSSNYTVTDSVVSEVYGELFSGTVVLEDVNDSTLNVSTTWGNYELCNLTGYVCTNDEVIALVDDPAPNDESDLHVYAPYRTAGDLQLIWDWKPGSNDFEFLLLRSESKALILSVLEEFNARDDGTQGTN